MEPRRRVLLQMRARRGYVPASQFAPPRGTNEVISRLHENCRQASVAWSILVTVTAGDGHGFAADAADRHKREGGGSSVGRKRYPCLSAARRAQYLLPRSRRDRGQTGGAGYPRHGRQL